MQAGFVFTACRIPFDWLEALLQDEKNLGGGASPMGSFQPQGLPSFKKKSQMSFYRGGPEMLTDSSCK